MKQKFHPILFSTPMVQAILAGNKTMTRRTKGLEVINKNPDDWQFEWADFILKLPWRFTQKSTVNEQSLKDKNFIQEAVKCPYGKPGDVLWVREKWQKLFLEGDDGHVDWNKPIIRYAADNPEPLAERDGDGFQVWNKDGSEKFISFKRSIHMPKSACRLFLQIKSIRVERLQDITVNDAVAEGIEPITTPPFNDVKKWGWRFKNYIIPSSVCFAVSSFKSLWESINGSDSWNANPWVWVVEFSKIGKPEGFI